MLAKHKIKDKLNIYYDEEGDFLEITIDPKKGYMKNIGKGIFHRVDKKTGKVLGIAIFSFRKRTEKEKEIKIPLPISI